MDSAKLNDWIQVVGIFALVASLLFVGLQIKQSQEIAIAAQYQERFSTATQFWTESAQNEIKSRRKGDELIGSWGLPDGFADDTSALELGTEYYFARLGMLSLDNLQFQYEAGFLTDDAWNGYRASLKRTLQSYPMYRYVLEHDGLTFRSSFRELCETLIKED